MEPKGLEKLLARFSEGDPGALEELLPVVYRELRSLASAFMARESAGHTLQPTALVHEAYLRLLPSGQPIRDRSHFLALSARAMRQILVEHARARQRIKRGGGGIRVQLHSQIEGDPGPEVEVLALNDGLDRLALEDERSSQVVELFYFAGLTIAEIAQVVGRSSRTVERDLTRARQKLGRMLGEPLASKATRSAAEARARPERPPAETGALPERIGRYPIRGILGEGGAGTVYLAYDPDLRREVALKRVHTGRQTTPPGAARSAASPEDPGAETVEEARILAALQHPNIATVYSLETDPEAGLFLTMERVAGRPLTEIFQSGSLSDTQWIEMARQIALGLEAAHEVGIVHGDLSPGNVLVDTNGRVRILDFGLARHLEPPPDEATPVAEANSTAQREPATPRSSPIRTGHVTGTPGYLSPERSRGDPPSMRDDIWAFGCLLYEGLTREPAFPGDFLTRIQATRERDPAWSAFAAGAGANLLSLTRRCLQKDPAPRPSSIRVVRRILESELVRVRTGKKSNRGGRSEPVKPPSVLPTPQGRFVGRQRERRELLTALETSRLVTVLGPGGVGKTRLVLETLGRALQVAGTIAFVDLTAGSLERSLFDALSAQAMPGEDWTEAIDRALTDQECVVVLDSCEAERQQCGRIISRLLPIHPGLRFIATSRTKLDLPGEEVLRLTPLAPSEPGDPTVRRRQLRDPAVRLFLHRAKEATGTESSVDVDLDLAERIVRHLDGLPLALELAAARLRVMTLPDLVARLDAPNLLHTSRSEVPARHRNLESVVRSSEELLSKDARRFFRTVSHLAPGWDLGAGEAVVEAVGLKPWQTLDLVTECIEQSLITVDLDPRGDSRARYSMLAPVAALARAPRSGNAGDTAEAILERTSSYYADRVSRACAKLGGPHAAEATAELLGDRPNWYRVLERLGEVGPRTRALSMVRALEPFWTQRGLWPEAREFCDRLLGREPLASRPPLDSGEAASDLGHVAVFRGSIHLYAGDLDQAESIYGNAATLARSLGDADLLGRCLHNLGGVALHRRDWDAARRHFAECMANDRPLGADRRLAVTANSLGLVCLRQEEFGEAANNFREAVDRSRTIGDRQRLGMFLNNLANAYIALGKATEADAVLEESERIHRSLGNAWGLAHTQVHLGSLAVDRGDFESGRTQFRSAVSTLHAGQDRLALAWAVGAWAVLEERAGRHELSCTLHAAADQISGGPQIELLSSVQREALSQSRTRLREYLGEETVGRLMRDAGTRDAGALLSHVLGE